MLPGLRAVLAAILATIVVVGFGLNRLATLQIAQTNAASPPKAAARFAGLAFAERADWTPDETRVRSLEQLAPFARVPAETKAKPAVIEATVAPAELRAPEPAKAAEPTAPTALPVILASLDASAAGVPELDAVVEATVEPEPEPRKAELLPIDLAAIRDAIGTPMSSAPAEPSAQAALTTAALDAPASEDATRAIAPSIDAAPAPPIDAAPVQALLESPPLPQARPAVPVKKAAAHRAPKRAAARPRPAKKKRVRTAKRTATKPASAPATAAPASPFTGLFGNSTAR